jgi:hypothetical protein
MKTFSTIVILIIGLIYFICDGNSYTFAAEVDGIPVEGYKSFADYSNGLLSIYTLLKDPAKKGIIIFVNASKPGVYLLNSEDVRGNHGQYHFGDRDNLTNFLTTSQYTGKCEITTLDLSNKKVSGTFEFVAVQLTSSGYGTRVVNIAKGTFEKIQIKESAEHQ